jgi:neutral ceramidase
MSKKESIMSDKMLVGAAEVIITPPVGTELAGYFQPRVSEGVISELKAKAVVAGDGAEGVAIIACDLITMTAEISAAARAKITAATGIPGERVMICSTHTHTGPELRAKRHIGRNEEWIATLPGLIADAAIAAAENQRPAVMSVGSEHEEGLAFNRRFRYRDGTELFGVHGDGSDVVGPAGPTDPEFGVVKFCADEGDDPFALICNYSVHIDVTGGNLISADFPAVMTDVIRGVYGPDTIVLYVQGACGNINHVPYLMERPWPRKGVEKSKQMGRAFAGKAIAIAEKALPSEDTSVDAAQEILQVPAHPLDDVVERNVAEAKAAAPPKPGGCHQRLLEIIDDYDPDKVTPREVQAIRLGDVVFCSAPGEYFVEWGLEIKSWSPFPYTFIAELANDSVGYIPTMEAFRRGGYEATPVVSVVSTPALGQMIADANFRHCEKLWNARQKS